MVHWGFEIIKTLVPPELWAQVHTTYCDPDPTKEVTQGITFFNGHTGDLLFSSPPAPIKRLLRHKLRQWLTTGINVRYNQLMKSFETVGDVVNVTFEDGSSTTVDFLVGADGAHSKMREMLLGDKAKCVPSDFVCGYASTVLGREAANMALKAHPLWTMAYSEMGVCAMGGTSPRPSRTLE